MPWIVKANIQGKRIASKIFKDITQAIIYADSTNRYRPGANARIKKV